MLLKLDRYFEIFCEVSADIMGALICLAMLAFCAFAYIALYHPNWIQ